MKFNPNAIYQNCDTGKYSKYIDGKEVECDKHGNVKMTREKAEKMLLAVESKTMNLDEFSVAYFLDGLQALGLIKFDEAKKISMAEAIYNARFTNGTRTDQSDFIKALNSQGYEIVKKS